MLWAILYATCLLSSACAQTAAATGSQTYSQRSIADRTVEWPTMDEWRRLVLLEDYNTRVVIIGVTLLGCAGGMVGSFTLLRKRALLGDALSHATLPGIAIAFMVATQLGYAGKSTLLLLSGAAVSGLLGVAAIIGISHLTRLKEDTALGAVLSVFFGAGAALLGIVQQMETGHAAGLESFIYGKTASMGLADTRLIGIAAVTCIATSLLLFKELKLLCFDDAFAGARGFPTLLLDIVLMGLVVVVTIVGLQAVGLILIIALLVIPAAAARFWTENLSSMFLISGAIGAISGLTGAGISALFSKLPSGAMIVLACTMVFVLSLVFGSSRGVLIRYLMRRALNRSIDRQHLLRALYELQEHNRVVDTGQPVATVQSMLEKRSWSRARLLREIKRSQASELVKWVGDSVQLTSRGAIEAERLTRQHRLWELYLITHADVAPGNVDRDADAIEHVLEPEVVAELEALLKQEQSQVPPSPHDITTSSTSTMSGGK